MEPLGDAKNRNVEIRDRERDVPDHSAGTSDVPVAREEEQTSFRRLRRPSTVLTSMVIVVLAGVWVGARVLDFPARAWPLTYVLPLLACVWTRRRWQLWGMAFTFVAMAFVDAMRPVPHDTIFVITGWRLFATTFTNVVIGAIAVGMIMKFRDDLEHKSVTIEEQNTRLARQAGELLARHEKIEKQSEELAQKTHEIQVRAGEVARQNEELQDANVRLASREEILQSLLQSSRAPETGDRALQEVCARAVPILGSPTEAVVLLERDGDLMQVRARASMTDAIRVPENWSLNQPPCPVVLNEGRTIYAYDIFDRPDLAGPLEAKHGVRSILATPVRITGGPSGVLMALSTRPSHWSDDQFRMIEWVAAQCGLMAEGLRWQRELQAHAHDIEAANRAKDHFLAMLSHELRTPLTPVLAAAGALVEDMRLPADVREDLRMVRRNVGIQSRLIDDLLDLTRIGQGKLDLACENLAVPLLLKQAADIVAPDLDAKDQTMALELSEIQGCAVTGDGSRLQQVFWNLFKNAIKFSPAKSRITVNARLVAGTPTRVAIDIIDGGVGISADDLDRIFRPFEQATMEGRRRGSDGGLGLGLSIAKAIVELHHGTIHAFSDGLDKGAKFTVELPLTDGLPRPESLSPFLSDVAVPPERALRILLVEDHVDTGRVLSRLLKNSGHVVEYVENAASAYALFQRREFDLVISDLGLPDESGLDLMRKLRALRPKIAGVCLSGYGMEEDVRACHEAGFAEHITKPVDIRRLRAVVARFAGNLSS
jgi:signal transduction histidine kinase/response regulator RpfG family c-di-GMP phosphodiesterase